MALTDVEIRNLKARPTGRYEVFDSKVPGFAIRVSPSGVKSFVLMYRSMGRLRRLTVGRYPVISLVEARRLASLALNRLNHGIDPQQQKHEERTQLRLAAHVESFIDRYCLRHNRDATAQATARILRTRFVTKLGVKNLDEIGRADVVGILDAIVGEGKDSAAIRALAAIRKFFNWTVERGLLEINPCAGIKAPAPHRSRDRVLSDEELSAIWRAAVAVGFPFGNIVHILILTAQRRGEVAGMGWGEISEQQRTWSIPAERTKSNRAHLVPLAPTAMVILSNVPRTSDTLVFQAVGNEETSFSGFSKSKRRLDLVARIDAWTLHDLRRTAATGMARLGVAPHVVERVLNHTTGTLGGVAGVYNRFGYEPEMRSALELWAAHIEAIERKYQSPAD